MEYVIAVVVCAILAFLLLRRSFGRATILEYQRGVLYRQGKLVRVLGPGAYPYLSARTAIQVVDLRPRFVTIAGQEVLSADNVGLKVSIAAKYQIVDPVQAIQSSESYHDALYLELQIALREIVSGTRIDALLEARQALSAQLLERARPNIAALGLTLHSATLKDIMFPGDLKRVFAQVVKAQKDGLAALEKARGESAALRNLANAAKLLENNPALMQLRILQAIGESTGNTVVVGLPPNTMPLPVPGRPPAAPPEQPARSSEPDV